MENFKAIIERRSPFSIKLLAPRYVVIHLERIKSLLSREDAVASRLDMRSYRQYVDELEHNWDDDIYMGCCVLREDDLAEKPIAVAIASAREYREDVRRPTELNWRKTEAYRDKGQQWSLDYLVRARQCRGVGCFVLVGLLESFCSQFDDWMLWHLLAGRFSNRNALSLYTDFVFLVRSLDDKNPIMSLQVHDIGQRACRKLVHTLTLRHMAAAAEQGGDGGDGGGGGDGGRDDGKYARRLRMRVRKGGVRRPAGRGVLADMENLTFRKIEDHLTIISGQLVLPAQTGGTEQAMIQHLWALSDRAALHPQSISFLIHLNVAKQCHTIACTCIYIYIYIYIYMLVV